VKFANSQIRITLTAGGFTEEAQIARNTRHERQQEAGITQETTRQDCDVEVPTGKRVRLKFAGEKTCQREGGVVAARERGRRWRWRQKWESFAGVVVGRVLGQQVDL
jgi:hypothetical protein